ncbi:MAG: caspase family protein [Armatimonadetes bacterium]|nr:caspase family protein [Armatimonadota bacterium]
MTGAPSLARRPSAYVLTIGVSRYGDSSYDLNYAAKDALETAETLKQNLPFAQDIIHVKTLPNERATRSNILASLRELSLRVQPEDTVIVSYSGHGILHKGHFYLIPHDLGKTGDESDLARHGIKDSDLEPIFLNLSAQQTALILDACHSGQALESDEWRRGPMNSRGLIQLAWEKGMEVLAASQSRQAALEAWQIGGRQIGHGLLTYALIKEAFTSSPRRDGRLLAKDWLDFAVSRVPHLLGQKDVKEKAIRLGSPGASPVQTPRVFHRREGGGDWAVGK